MTLAMREVPDLNLPADLFSGDVMTDLDGEKIPKQAYYKVYHDGSHFVGTLAFDCAKKKTHVGTRCKSCVERSFDSFYQDGMSQGLRSSSLFSFVKKGISSMFGTADIKKFSGSADIDSYVETGLKRKKNNYWHRIKRFRRKANLNKWTHFVTLTYDDELHTETSFRQKLRKCLANFSVRRGWRYMGVFERAPETDRLHFHALMYIPACEMVGSIVERKDFSIVSKRMQVTHANTFFEDRFGRSDFVELSDFELKKGRYCEYITKYLSKTGEKIVYSRGVPERVTLLVKAKDILTTVFDYVKKFIFFDNSFVWDRDIVSMSARQTSIFERSYCVV